LKVGIPRALYYHSYPGLWETFFEALGMETVISEKSSRTTVEIAALVTESEHCLPHKLFDGHVHSLVGKVDAVFIPRVLSMVNKYICCTKFGALPDASKCGVAKDIPVLTFDINETARPLRKSLVDFGVSLGYKKKLVKLATAKGFARMALELEKQQKANEKLPDHDRFLLLGHPYTLHDSFIADPIVRKLRALHIPTELMSFQVDDVPRSHIRWCSFNKMYQKLLHLDPKVYSGVVQISTFNCGADSTMVDGFRRVCQKRGIPFLVLMVDEHSGQAGLETRLEAFVDSLMWKKTLQRVEGAHA